MYSLKNKNVLIVGGLGLIGQATTKKFLSLKANVVCLDIKHNNYKELKNFLLNFRPNFPQSGI